MPRTGPALYILWVGNITILLQTSCKVEQYVNRQMRDSSIHQIERWEPSCFMWGAVLHKCYQVSQGLIKTLSCTVVHRVVSSGLRLAPRSCFGIDWSSESGSSIPVDMVETLVLDTELNEVAAVKAVPLLPVFWGHWPTLDHLKVSWSSPPDIFSDPWSKPSYGSRSSHSPILRPAEGSILSTSATTFLGPGSYLRSKSYAASFATKCCSQSSSFGFVRM